ncbi:FERM, ARHGEF and pleckstrin domain-containing protein 1 isoform X1 [Anastrepha ludens]|uniref:FERM, ARHGEF and pleckstrin domain-containing protein 1 isoform X1 n=1 Tax=Anastrepha ludens TaxID=28586 RepID=UPI0023B0859B|nr:FERM, ARHGEF and pleckstrin domain-containing protein 1 isoform X1 [Anastrepha ludens]XP_053961769.1 FERM, ARHGEF and pleckstrin domain-containing protein 1 isoform X1 [Anastrepha ludens]XP_053961775.1 FERM, ARHGEF and pleckstrin domain-containing protein 1 isoform X1 [Anastrepha ludens]XP_053961784.1 FERM, ARHGEF and pleckstrin domain-containing protein 1 isoform X1 [Anastrepha ludens]XP_053961792.1 FERM, ARHGEF and pleckstrin domain-containing protein 1 isoform X1 [Anastrepha ludens]XP_05
MSLADMGTATRGGGMSGGGVGVGGGGVDIGIGVPGGRMTHSLSTPSGVDGTPSTPRHRGGKKLTVRIQMLDDSVTMFQVQAKALGRVLFEQVCRQLNLLEADYFGLEYQEISTHTKYWLDLEKPLNRQVGLSLIDPVLRFCVKFYTPDPAQLEEEYTRYLFCLQIKRDLANGSLQCNDNTAALMASYIVQASCGDYVPEDYPDHTYLSSYRFVPHQDASMQRKIMENHKKHVGQSPAEADLNLLETARRCELYGMKMHPAKDVEGVPLNLAVAHMGIAVFQNITRINTFSWAKIRKISFKRKRFLVKLHPEGYGYYKDTVEFFFEGRNECKNFWKKCVENHGFFRCAAVQNQPRRKARVLSRGSSFRYSGKTQKQIIEFVRENYVKRQNFQRSQSFRQGPLNASSRSQSHTYVNSSISANPLLPIDTADWDYRNQCTASTTLSLTKKAADTLDRRQDNPTDHTRSQVTAAQVEIYQTKNYAPESPTLAAEQQHHSAAAMDQMNSNRSVSPQGPGSWTSPNHSSQQHSSMRAQDQARAHQGDHNLEYHGINGNMSLDRRGEVATPQNRYDLTLGSDKSSSLSRSEAGTYDVIQAEIQHAKRHELPTGVAMANNNNGPHAAGSSLDTDNDTKKRKWPTEKSYFLAKELLMTERTYKKDLEILNRSFRQELSAQDVENLQPLFDFLDSMAHHHSTFLRDIEHRMVLWEGRGTHDTHRIGDVMMKNIAVLPIYDEYIQSHKEILNCMNEMFETDERFQQIYKDFEQQKLCYLPIGELLLKPLTRILHYQLILERLCDFYTEEHIDYGDCQAVYHILLRTAKQIREQLPESENFVQLCELQRDITGFDKLVQHQRRLIRQGCLLKHSKRGLQQRMFFLFSDILLYGTKSPIDQSFRIFGHVPVRSLLTENAEHNTFSIFGGQCAITVSAGTTAEKTLWLAELSKAAADIKNKPPTQLTLTSLKNCSSSEEGLDLCGLTNGLTAQQLQQQQQQSLQNKTPPSRSNTALHVCWHRGATVGLGDHLISAENQLSGYLLRKFKNSSGWQKLWVVFTSFCLYFYKSYQDEFALASLPLLGYSVGPPGHQDTVQKEFVFKLSFKNHVYFFRAESIHTYNRWLEVLRSTTQTQDFKNINATTAH